MALASATGLLAAFWPVLAWAARRRAENGLAGREAGLERQRQALAQNRQALERDRQDSTNRLDALRQELEAARAQALEEAEDRFTGIQITLENAWVGALDEADKARAEAAEARARADRLQKRLEGEERRRKNAVAASTRLRLKHRPDRPSAP